MQEENVLKYDDSNALRKLEACIRAKGIEDANFKIDILVQGSWDKSQTILVIKKQSLM